MTERPPGLLVLLDIDGTLVWRAAREHAQAVIAGMVYLMRQRPS